MKKIFKRSLSVFLGVLAITTAVLPLTGCDSQEEDDAIVLRISNWEEYIDEGEWDEEDAIDLDEDNVICPENSMIDDFEEWFYETYGKEVRVEYSTFGTNEELYNQIIMGDTYDLVCPSEYMIMKMMVEDMLVPFSEDFYDETIEENYYAKGVSPYIRGVYDELSIEGKTLSQYAAGYMWGTLGIVYNPEVISEEEASSWRLLMDERYSKQITIKDSVRDAYFAGNCIYNYSTISSKEFLEDKDYYSKLSSIINATDQYTLDAVENILSRIKDNVYSFETDSGKADMVTGKVVANQQWSGDAVYTMDQADEDGVELCYAAPSEGTNLWFDGWCMLNAGIAGDSDKQMAAEAFVNFVSRPDNAVRNMWYIGYTSVIAGGEDSTMLDYANWTYGAEDDEEEVVDYDISYFFAGPDAELTEEEMEMYTIVTTSDQAKRQLYAQYPTKEVVDRSVVMEYFDMDENERINRMWLNVRCFDLYSFLSDIF